MTATVQDVLKANIVLVGVHLLAASEQLEAFQQAVDTDVVSSGFGLNVGATGNTQDTVHVLTISRDRITLELSSAKSTIERDYPSDEDLDRLGDIAGLALEKTGSAVHARAFGYNVELVYVQDSGLPATEYLAQRLFAGALPTVGESQLSGGRGTLSFVDGTTHWNVSVESRFRNDKTAKVFLSLNMHANEQRVPSEDEIKASLRRTWKEAITFIERIDESVTQ